MPSTIFKISTVIWLSLTCSALAVGQWQSIQVDTDASFRSLHLVDKNIAWAGGSKSTVLRTIDGGANWQVFRPGGNLDFRGICGLDRQTAVAMSAGEAEKGAAKILRTSDGGATWKEVFATAEAGVFLDCIKFSDPSTGYVLGDPIGGKPYLLKTTDGGRSWSRIEPSVFPDMMAGEASFASSNSNISITGKIVRFSTQSRVFISNDEGKSWKVYSTPFEQGTTSGIFGLYFVNKRTGFAVGGDYVNDKADYPNIARTADGGKTWQFTQTAQPHGLKESIWQVGKKRYLAVGTSGSSLSSDGGKTWQPAGDAPYHVIQCVGKTCLAIGANGQLAKWKN
ncbi:MAG: oxidoreductase [Lewinellaceae bacterium]|nr:oxidoreductase [Lewinellaceae bacterium]